MRLHLVVILVAILTQMVQRLSRRWLAPPSDPSASAAPPVGVVAHILVLLSVPIRSTWRESIVHMITQAKAPRNLTFAVLLECTRPSDADLGDDLGSDLRPFARLVHARAPRTLDPVHRHRRLVRRFVEGDESLVVVADHRVRVARGWDEMCYAALHDTGRVQQAVLSAPAASRDGTPAFPTRRRRSDGVHVARDAARRIEGPPSVHAMPSVCWCAEFTAGHPLALRGWSKERSAVAQTENVHRFHVVPALPLVEEDRRVEEEYLDTDEGCANAPYGPHERIGLTRQADDEERIRKFGSSRAARLAIQFS